MSDNNNNIINYFGRKWVALLPGENWRENGERVRRYFEDKEMIWNMAGKCWICRRKKR